jgi:hypothetical protein
MARSKFVRLATAAAALSLVAAPATAAFVTFEEIPYEQGEMFGQAITDQYASLGLLVNDGYLAQGSGTGQFLAGGSGFGISFIEAAQPRYVSFNMNSMDIPGAEAYVRAFNGTQQVGFGRTGGFFPTEDGPQQVLPYVPNRLISFAVPEGITHLSFSNSYIARFTASIDNLYFGPVPAVPEPHALLLAAAGVPLLVGVARWRARRKGKAVASTTT